MAKNADFGKTSKGMRPIQDRDTKLTALDVSIARGVADAHARRVKTSSEVFDNLESELRAKAARR
jgi:antitoxin ParD1/3/4